MAKKYIDAEQLKQTVETSMDMQDLYLPSHFFDVIDGMPAADVAPRWIPVTERLPKLYTDVILSVRQGYAFGEPDNWCVVGELIDKEDITWATNYGFHDLLYSNGKKHTVWVSAWMPLPEPYKGGEEEWAFFCGLSLFL